MGALESFNERGLLQKESLGEDKPVNRMDPVVSICVTTYQHAGFITECLEGMLCQRTRFPYEIVIGEDESTDGTREICMEYARKYPDKIRLLLRDRELSQYYEDGVLKTRFNWKWTLRDCRGKYVAWCEGDDYWTDPDKLQKQVDFMELHPDYVLCHHNVEVQYEDGSKPSHLSNAPDQPLVTDIRDLARGNYIYTASCMYRNNLFPFFPGWVFGVPVGDYVMHMLNARFGKIGYLPDVMAVYRIHQGGVWGPQSRIVTLERWLKVLAAMIGQFDIQVEEILREQYTRLTIELFGHYMRQNDTQKAAQCLEKPVSCLNAEQLEPCRMLLDQYAQQQQLQQQLEETLRSTSFRTGRMLVGVLAWPRTVWRKLLSR